MAKGGQAAKPSKPGASKRISNEALLVHILAIHAEVKQEYGWPKMCKELLARGIRMAMSRKGNCWDNAPTESLWCRLKVGRLYGRNFATRREAMDEVMDWLNFYNHKRLHSTLGYVSTMTFEQRWTAAQQQDKKSA